MLQRRLWLVLVTGLVAGVACDDETGPAQEEFEADLTGAAERPNPVTTNATGRATFTVNANSVDFTITVQNIADAFAAHIHGPATTSASAGVLVTLFSNPQPGVDIASGTLSTGTFPSANFTITAGVTLDSVLVLMRNGMAYVNVHTVANLGGHIRGQISEN